MFLDYNARNIAISILNADPKELLKNVYSVGSDKHSIMVAERYTILTSKAQQIFLYNNYQPEFHRILRAETTFGGDSDPVSQSSGSSWFSIESL